MSRSAQRPLPRGGAARDGRRSREVWFKEVSGLLRAYLLVRLVALREDLSTPFYGGEMGIEWEVQTLERRSIK